MGTVHPIKEYHEERPEKGQASPQGTSGSGGITGKTDDALPAVNVVHAISGRLRFVFPKLRHRKEMLSNIAGRIASRPGVERVRPNHFCASITVEYDHLMVDQTSLVEYATSLGEEDLPSPSALEAPGKGRSKNHETVPGNLPVKSSALWTIGGTLFVGMSFLGVIVPGLPTPPFVILAAYCYLRGSKRHYRWLMNHPIFGKLVEETESGPRISHGAKKITVYFLWFSIFLSCIFFVHSILARLLVIISGIVVSCLMLRK